MNSAMRPAIIRRYGALAATLLAATLFMVLQTATPVRAASSSPLVIDLGGGKGSWINNEVVP